MNRPALKVAILYVLGILLGYYLDLSIHFLLAGSSLCLALFFLSRKGTILYLTVPSLIAGLILTGFLRYELSTSQFSPYHITHYLDFPEPLTIRGKIVKDPEVRGDRTFLTMRVTELGSGKGNFIPVVGKVLVKVQEEVEWLSYGDWVELVGRLYAPPPARNPGAFDYRRYLHCQGIFGLVRVRQTDPIRVLERGKGGFFPSRVVLPVREWIASTVDRHLSGPPGALLKGILLGERRTLSRQVQEAFSDAGVVHVLAVSGLHVGLVVLIFLGFFQALRVPHSMAIFMSMAVIVLYMFVTDLRPSVVRASIMAGVVLGGLVLERNSDIFNTVAFAALLILLFWPQALFEVGFQLSFVATLAIVYLYRPIRGLFPGSLLQDTWWGRWLFEGIAISLAAQLGIAPIIAYYFHRLPLISLVANLIVVPLVGVVVALGFAAVIFGLIGAKLALLFNAANWLALSSLLKVVGFFAHLPFASFRVASPSPIFLASYFSLLILAAQVRDQVQARKGLVFLILVLVNLWVWREALSPSGRELEVTFLDVGQGNATFIRFPKGETMLIDGGPKRWGFDSGERIIAPYLEHLGVKKIDRLVLTNPYNEHVGGLVSILENFQVGEVIDGGQAYPSRGYQDFLDLIAQKGIPRRVVRAGEEIEGFARGRIFVLHPTGEFVTPKGQAPYGARNGSVVLRLVYGKVSFLFLGDVEEEAEQVLLRYGAWLKSTVVKVPYHGGEGSSGERLVRMINPRVAIISVGRWNRFGCPSREVVERYLGLGAVVYRTDWDGAITLRTDGERLEVKKMIKGGKRGQ